MHFDVRFFFFLNIVDYDEVIQQTAWECLISAENRTVAGLIHLDKTCGFSAVWKQGVF